MRAKRKRTTLVPSEHDEQVALFQWAELMKHQLPELEMMYAIPNGGMRNKVVAGKLKAEGVKAGVLDIFLPVARGEYHGLYIEMKKAIGGVVSAEQQWWINMLRAQGYCVVVCHGAGAAMVALERYLTSERRRDEKTD
jgi:hypothetical protein